MELRTADKSGYLDSILIGGEIEVFRMGVKKRQAGGEMLGIISFGVGITETLPVVAHELERGALNGFGEGEESGVKNVIFVWASKTKLDIFWHNKIKKLQKKYGQRFKFITMLSREYFSNDDGKGILDYADDIIIFKPDYNDSITIVMPDYQSEQTILDVDVAA